MRRLTAGRWAAVGGGAAATLAWLELAARVAWPAITALHWPSPGYWVAGRLVLEGRIDLVYAEAPVFGAEAIRLGSVPDIFSTNAPPTVLPFLPLAALPETVAHAVWLTAGLAAFVVAWWSLLRFLAIPAPAALGATALVPLFTPLRENVARGQAYLVLLALIVAAGLLASRPGRARRFAALALAGAGVLKLYYGLIVGLVAGAAWATDRARRGVVPVAGLLGLLVAGLMVLAWGVGPWIAAVEAAAGWRTRPESSVTAYQTINGLLNQLFRPDPTWNPSVAADAPGLATAGWVVAVGLVAAITIGAVRAVSSPSVRYRLPPPAASAIALAPLALGVLAALLVAPIAEDYHFTLVLLPVCVAGVLLWRGAMPAQGVAVAATALLVGLGLLGLPWPYEVADAPGWSALVHYPRVYGTVLVWGVLAAVCLAAGRRDSSERPSG